MKKIYMDTSHWKDKTRNLKNDVKNMAMMNIIYAGLVIGLLLFNAHPYIIFGISILYMVFMYMVVFGVNKAIEEETEERIHILEENKKSKGKKESQ
jgi:amino acid transporter